MIADNAVPRDLALNLRALIANEGRLIEQETNQSIDCIVETRTSLGE